MCGSIHTLRQASEEDRDIERAAQQRELARLQALVASLESDAKLRATAQSAAEEKLRAESARQRDVIAALQGQLEAASKRRLEVRALSHHDKFATIHTHSTHTEY